MSQLTLKSSSPGQSAGGPLAYLSRAGFGVITLLAIALFGWANPVFLTVDNWANLLQGSAILLIVAMAMTLIVSAGPSISRWASHSTLAPPLRWWP
ncbi:Predicted ABC-type sugar transport system, permease component [Raoultella terrigena]|uniref:Predicted ABC-type sugar transport system, permease component n=1 Tax=Raoultella terrigena TaxID=577 RepID=A0A4U9D8L0_RAOTE|nr:Predicted ABC-type sugar transport system, permease component [Raoultella terrigena]